MFKIGNVEIKGKVILAPMAGVTNLVYRKMVQSLGASLVTTEMVSNIGFKHKSKKTKTYALIGPDEVASIQIFGGEIEDYVKAAKYYDKNSNAKIIDINMGCPVKKVAIKSESGSALTKSPEKVAEIVKAVTNAIKKPLTIKIRIGWDEESLTHVKVAKLAELNGVSAITVHGRTRSQFYEGKSDWSKIKEVKDAVSIPVIGNGDVKTPEDAQKMIDQTGVDAIMVARAARDNPWVIKQMTSFLETGKYDPAPDIHKVSQTIKEYRDQMETIRSSRAATIETRGVAYSWLKRFKGKKQLLQKINQAILKSEFETALDNYVKTVAQ